MHSALRTTSSLLMALTLGCVTSRPALDRPAHPEPANAADTVFWLLAGRFDSADQARSTPAFPALQVVACPAEVAGMGPRVLYLEQARMDSPGAPYEQRVFVVEPLVPGATVAVSRTFELADPRGAVGACDRGTPPRFTRDELVERLGCAVRVQAEGSVWRGSTSGHGCRTTLEGAAYSTTEVVLQALGFRSWERGYDVAGNQTWGVDSTPFVFVRRTPLQ